MIAAALHNAHPARMVFVLPDREDAAYFLNDLENILGDKTALFFPSSLKKPYQFPYLDNNNVLLRAEVLTHLSKNTKPLPVVTYAEAFHERVVTKKALVENTVEARVGEALSIDFIIEFLSENDFERSDFVLEAGQFAVRGGIVDVFSFANEMPYRVEFDGNKIESIRVFDPGTQLSEKNMNHITIIPNVQGKLVKEEHQSFLDFLPAETIIWCKDFINSLDVIQAGMKIMNDSAASPLKTDDYNESGVIAGTPENAFDDTEKILTLINQFRIVESGNKFHFTTDQVISFNSGTQPSFNKNFELLGNKFLENSRLGYKNLIFSDTAKQIERIYAIFNDIQIPARTAGEEIQFTPVLLTLHEGFIDHDLKLACYTDHQIFDRYHRFRLRKNYSKDESLTLKEIYSLKPGDFITHIDHGVGKFAGLEKIDVNGKTQEAIRLVYKDNDMLYVSIHSLHRIARFTGKDGTVPKLNKLGSQAWANLKQKTKKRVKDIAKDLIALYAQRRSQKGFAFTKDNYLQTELEASFIYEDTPDQIKSTADLKKDMEKPYPMDRLICGDVGFGKTEVAIRAAFKAVNDSKQVAILVPTTILALQHFKTFSERLKDFPCTVDYLNRFKSAAQQTITIDKLKEGKIDIVIGTHRLLSKDIKFKDLGLLIIDEEQKFGVASKEKLKALRLNVDTLTLTATPIPRTLQFSLMGARDLSVINTPPPNRYPVSTEVHVFNEKTIKEAIDYEVARGGQVFFVHNRVQDIHVIQDLIHKLCPGVRIGVGHGQMDGDQLEKVLTNFIEGDTDVLIATTIIESGIDISNANTIIINQAHHFGLSDLHQMRGRVGRSNKKAFCYLLAPPLSVLTPEAKRRLKAIEEFSDLGSGFNVAMRDLDIRGAGNMLGGEQSGFISEIGYEMYHKILDEAIRELKETEFKEIFKDDEHPQFVSDCSIDTDLEILIPSEYISNITERLNIYKEIDDLERKEQLHEYLKNLRDRFGPVPGEVQELMNAIQLRWKAKELGFEKIMLKGGILKGYFNSNPESSFYRSKVFSDLIAYVQANPNRIRLTEKNGKLSISFSAIKSLAQANEIFESLKRHVTVEKEQSESKLEIKG
ncbi:MAG: transcription-repair coupling factor [Bacteroidetes bacterium]|nr:transcription-repair coupling factor [Bacteroidota bacterium]